MKGDQERDGPTGSNKGMGMGNTKAGNRKERERHGQTGRLEQGEKDALLMERELQMHPLVD